MATPPKPLTSTAAPVPKRIQAMPPRPTPAPPAVKGPTTDPGSTTKVIPPTKPPVVVRPNVVKTNAPSVGTVGPTPHPAPVNTLKVGDNVMFLGKVVNVTHRVQSGDMVFVMPATGKGPAHAFTFTDLKKA